MMRVGGAELGFTAPIKYFITGNNVFSTQKVDNVKVDLFRKLAKIIDFYEPSSLPQFSGRNPAHTRT